MKFDEMTIKKFQNLRYEEVGVFDTMEEAKNKMEEMKHTSKRAISAFSITPVEKEDKKCFLLEVKYGI